MEARSKAIAKRRELRELRQREREREREKKVEREEAERREREREERETLVAKRREDRRLAKQVEPWPLGGGRREGREGREGEREKGIRDALVRHRESGMVGRLTRFTV